MTPNSLFIFLSYSQVNFNKTIFLCHLFCLLGDQRPKCASMNSQQKTKKIHWRNRWSIQHDESNFQILLFEIREQVTDLYYHQVDGNGRNTSDAVVVVPQLECVLGVATPVSPLFWEAEESHARRDRARVSRWSKPLPHFRNYHTN